MTVQEIAEIIMRRDNISYNEAMDLVEQCQDELEILVQGGGSLDDAEDCVAYWLGLEPDYLITLLDG